MQNKWLSNPAAIWFHGGVYERLYRKPGWNLFHFIVVVFVLAILASALVPTFNSVAPRANQAETASNCRQIIAALKMYAADHDGKYPDAHSSEPTTSNAAFRILIKEGYLADERIFGARVSPYIPDDIIGDAPDFPKALEAGENHWAMAKVATTESPALMPLVFENPASPSWPPKWNADAANKTERGRTWRGGKIIVGFDDSSVQTVKLESDKGESVGPKKDADGKDVFTRAAELMEILDIEW